MTIKQYKIWILLKLKLKNGYQEIVRVGYVKFTLIEQVFFKKTKKSELFFIFYRTDQFVQCFEGVKQSVKKYLQLTKAYTKIKAAQSIFRILIFNCLIYFYVEKVFTISS